MTNSTISKSNPKRNLLTPRQALVLARQACTALLHGQPDPATFEPDDLYMAIDLLDQMVATIAPGQVSHIEAGHD